MTETLTATHTLEHAREKARSAQKVRSALEDDTPRDSAGLHPLVHCTEREITSQSSRIQSTRAKEDPVGSLTFREVLERLNDNLGLDLAAGRKVKRLDRILAVANVCGARGSVTRLPSNTTRSIDSQEPTMRRLLKTVQKTLALMYVSGGRPTATRVPCGRRYSSASL